MTADISPLNKTGAPSDVWHGDHREIQSKKGLGQIVPLRKFSFGCYVEKKYQHLFYCQNCFFFVTKKNRCKKVNKPFYKVL